MRKGLLASVGAAALAVSSIANSAIVIDSVNPGTNPYTGPVPTYDFDGSTPAFVGGAVVGPGTTPGQFAQPWGSSGQYYSVGPSTTSPGTIDLTGYGDIFSISLLWGSVDAYNSLAFLDSGMNVLATFTGTDIFNPATGDQTDPNTNPWVLFSLTDGDVSAFSYLQLSSTQNAFEIDNIAINPVPEPGTWAMMLIGFGAVGFGMRRRRREHVPQLA